MKFTFIGCSDCAGTGFVCQDINESKRLWIVLVARVKRAKLGSPGWIHAPTVISAARTLKSCTNFDLEGATADGGIDVFNKASEIIPAAGRPYCETFFPVRYQVPSTPPVKRG